MLLMPRKQFLHTTAKRKLKHKFQDAIQALADCKAAESSCCFHTVNSKRSAKRGTGAGTTAGFRARTILTPVDHSTQGSNQVPASVGLGPFSRSGSHIISLLQEAQALSRAKTALQYYF